MPRQIAKVGDVFWVPIDDGTFVLGQIVEIEKMALNSITCAFYDCRRAPNEEPLPVFSKLISIQFVTKDLFNSGEWARQCNLPIYVQPSQLPYRETKSKGWVGVKIIGSGIIRMFLSAFYGLRNWQEMKDPDYYQNLLLKDVDRKTA